MKKEKKVDPHKWLRDEVVKNKIYFKTFGKYSFDINDDDVIVDIGANVGYFVEAVVNTKKRVKMLCYEPVISNFVELTDRTFALNKNIVINLINEGVSNRVCDKEIYVTDDIGCCSTSKELIKREVGFIPKTQKFHCESMKNVLKKAKRIDFLKIDCEGEEYNILNSLNKKDYSRIHKIAMEYHKVEDPNLTRNPLYIVNKFINMGWFVVLIHNKKEYGMMYMLNKEYKR